MIFRRQSTVRLALALFTFFSMAVSADLLSQNAPVCGDNVCERDEFCPADCQDIDYWSTYDVPKTSWEEKLELADMSTEQWQQYIADQLQQGQDLSNLLDLYIRDWLAAVAPAEIPPGILPPSIDSPKTHSWTLLHTEQIVPEDQWYYLPARPEPAEDGFSQLHQNSAATHVTYLKMPFLAPFGARLIVEGDFPHARQMSFHISPPFDPEFPRAHNMGTFEVPLMDVDITPEPGHFNPFQVGADRNAPNRRYRVIFELSQGNSYELNPVLQDPHFRHQSNTRVGGPFESTGPYGSGTLIPGILWLRYYVPDRRPDGTFDALGGVDLPTATLQLETGEEFWLQPNMDLTIERQLTTAPGKQTAPIDPGDELGPKIGWLKIYSILLANEEAEALFENGIHAPDVIKAPIRDKFLKLFNHGPFQPAPGSIGHSASDHAYNEYLTRGMILGDNKVYAIRGTLPVTPGTAAGNPVMEAGQARYWSICHSGEQNLLIEPTEFNNLVYGCLFDEEIRTDEDRNFLIVYSRGNERPANATEECGVTWQESGPESTQGMVIRWMNVYPDHYMADLVPSNENIPWEVGAWSEPGYDQSQVGENQANRLGDYHPIVHYFSKTEFESLGCPLDLATLPAWESPQKPPFRFEGRPEGRLPLETTEVMLSLQTDESGLCRYSDIPDLDFEEMVGTFDMTGGTVHEAVVTGLSGPELYNFYARCQDYENYTNRDDFVISFGIDVDADATPPTVPQNLQGVAISDSEIHLAWSPSSDDQGVSAYHVYKDGVPIETTSQASYQDLQVLPLHQYTYEVSASDPSGNESDRSLPIEVQSGDTTPPTKPAYPQTTVISDTQIDISWQEAWDQFGVAGYRLYNAVDGSLIVDTALTYYSHTGLSPWTVYDYYLTAYDQYANEGQASRVFSRRTTDSVAPTAPQGLTAVAVTENQNDLSWQAATDNVEVDRYRIYRDGSRVGYTNETFFSDSLFTPTEAVSYTVTAVDAAGNESAPSVVAIVGPLDLTPPTKPGYLQATVVSDTQIDLSWNASYDKQGVVGYRIYESDQFIDEVPETSYSHLGLNPGASYTYYVIAIDAAGNQSPPSRTVSKTLQDSIPPTKPEGLTATVVSSNQVDLSWEASSDNVQVAGYKIYRNGWRIAKTAGPATSYSDTATRSRRSYTYTVVAYDDARNDSEQSDPVTIETP